MEKHCENISNVLLGMLNAKCCLSWSKANQTVMPEHLQAEKWFRKQFQIRFVRSSMWQSSKVQFFVRISCFVETNSIFFFGWPDAMVLVGFAITAFYLIHLPFAQGNGLAATRHFLGDPPCHKVFTNPPPLQLH